MECGRRVWKTHGAFVNPLAIRTSSRRPPVTWRRVARPRRALAAWNMPLPRERWSDETGTVGVKQTANQLAAPSCSGCRRAKRPSLRKGCLDEGIERAGRRPVPTHFRRSVWTIRVAWLGYKRSGSRPGANGEGPRLIFS
jgi:hypothetical protein